MKHIGVGSLSPHKTGATEDALLRPGHVFSGQGRIILPHYARSGIDAQPFGAGIAGLGAKRRAVEILNANPELDYAVGIENFLELVLQHWLDIPMVAIAKRSETGPVIVGVASGVGYPIPQKFVLEAMAAGFDLYTAGEFLAAKQRTEDKTDPVAGLTGRLLLRRQLIADAVYAALIQIPE